ncbi:MAG: trypsin-like peptidase domain-containing protein, partial [Gammaproteobacteria bacterium]
MKQLLAVLFCVVISATNVLAEDEPSWDVTLEKISSGVVSIQIDSTRAFDTDRNQSTQATGFVVDAEKGLILTNRHVVTAGPVVAQAVFVNQEEVELVPLYRDPVHDFGFFRYDPRALRFIEPKELELVPEAAQIGRDIRIVGNDAGEQLSILSGTIARLDRAAPNYGRGNYNDFNTFYLQAASGTSGGSSGSPVIDIEGRVVALNAGASSQAATSFFLPLERVGRALSLIREGRFVDRGTLQIEFVHKPYAELRRLGLTELTEATNREVFPARTGLLVIEQVIPGSAASEVFQLGDILVSINHELVSEFVSLAAMLDGNVGHEVLVEIERRGTRIRQEIVVDDLHLITPDEFIEYGDGVFHNLSYQQAWHFNRPVLGVYTANPGHIFGTAAIPRASLIIGIDGRSVISLDDFQQRFEALSDQQRVTVRFVTLDDSQTEKLRLITNDRRWFPAKRCKRDDQSGLWP